MSKTLSNKYRVYVEKSGFFTSIQGKPLALSYTRGGRARVRTGLVTSGGSAMMVWASDVWLDAYQGCKLPEFDTVAFRKRHKALYEKRIGTSTRSYVSKAIGLLRGSPKATYHDLVLVATCNKMQAMSAMTIARKKLGIISKHNTKKKEQNMSSPPCHGWIDDYGHKHQCPLAERPGGDYRCRYCRSVHGKSVRAAADALKKRSSVRGACHAEDDFRAGML